jgi:hypothetical protein
MAWLQTKKGTAAKGLTAAEFTEEAHKLHVVSYNLYRRDPAKYGYALRFSWDHCSAHESALPDIDILPEQLLDIPARSPDVHLVPEDAHSMIHHTFRKRLREDARVNTVDSAVRLLRQVADDVITPDYIQKLVDKLPHTLEAIVEKKGDYVAKRYRS